MSIQIKVPAVGESITEATIGSWVKKSGDSVQLGEVILSLETDKASVEVVAEVAGLLTTTAKEGDVVKIGAVVGSIDPTKAGRAEKPTEKSAEKSATAPTKTSSQAKTSETSTATPAMMAAPTSQDPRLSPSVRRMAAETGVDTAGLQGTGKDGRLTKKDLMGVPGSASVGVAHATPSVGTTIAPTPNGTKTPTPAGAVNRVPMTTIRKKIAERLVQAQQTAAILTTFNEVDMTSILELRQRYKDQFEKRYNVRLGFMGFFVKACIQALKEFPAVNASIDGTDILYKNFYNIGVAVSTPKGLVVPVIRNADQMSLAQIEIAINDFANKARDGKITVEDMAEGTFTVSNGGVFGSLMSTPILNPPQSGILGMHKTEKRAVVVNDQIVIRPMMYVALSYDHRMIDGRESVSFLVRVKECLEDPSRLVMEI